MKTTSMLLLSAAALFVSGAAGAQTIIAPTSAVIDSNGPGFGPIADTFNQSGLSAGYTSGVTNFDSYLAGNPTHNFVFGGNEWFSNSGVSSAIVTYDFGSTQTIDRLALWNEDASGIGSLNLFGSIDGISFSALGSYSPTNGPINTNYPADVFSFAATGARYVRFEMSGCPQAGAGSFPGCAIGEVAFRTAAAGPGVPEPASWALMIGGFGVVGGVARRRRVRTSVAFA